MRFFYYIFALAFLASCAPRKPIYNYLQEIKDTSFRKTAFIAEPVIQKNDLLTIKITSASLDPKADQPYNQSAVSQGSTLAQEPGYLVDVNGDILMPRLGKVHAEGLTKSELERTIRAKLVNTNQLTDPTVSIRFLNFRITVLGEVASPGVLTIASERVTILEAVGLSGGITEFGSIRRVRVLRETNGVRETGFLDLTSKDIFESRFYQMQQNDVVLVDQTEYKVKLAEQQRLTQQITFGLAILTSTAILLNFFRK
ncbi:hypothetical protein EPD60_09160 [Flaviaesturariibacter flavus]|uniref:Uncharacterized protein n=1 Tax=Flaviaesturariibacter flavus TaxID=2502780 RepID=A0A4R1BB03_9BACT|nr:polysaccharide biosynthesis/export family protein [Flaviaesturariibacter flavus]TCJ14165.1 hypothetical protein EPD60_09160 [Flaviaesturariibacter flavus]